MTKNITQTNNKSVEPEVLNKQGKQEVSEKGTNIKLKKNFVEYLTSIFMAFYNLPFNLGVGIMTYMMCKSSLTALPLPNTETVFNCDKLPIGLVVLGSVAGLLFSGQVREKSSNLQSKHNADTLTVLSVMSLALCFFFNTGIRMKFASYDIKIVLHAGMLSLFVFNLMLKSILQITIKK